MEEQKPIEIEDHMGLVGYFANYYLVRAYPQEFFEYDDFFQEGSIGLFKAIKTFKPEKGFKFSTYAGRCISNQILMYIRKQTRNIELPILDAPIPNKKGETDTITYLDTLNKRSENTEAEAMANVLYDFLSTPRRPKTKNYKTKRVVERETQTFKLLMYGYKQTEMKYFLGISQRVAARHVAEIRERVRTEWGYEKNAY